ncbi:MAG: DUF421 domain-containing protein [Gemmatimonadetes bacterium]|nr:DUF421 domain-containing protein [Gemmatimonadota bacterium]NNL29620.1 DUF421 domain-containing protein [Gemmatimonadota bacterium]
MDWSWIETTGSAVAMSALTALCMYVVLIAFTRVVGLRSFSKMSSFDFALTVAFGSLLATAVLSPQPSLLLSAAALASLFAIQWAVTGLRARAPALRSLLDNEPTLLMWQGEVREAELRSSGVTHGDLMAKLREANVLRFSQVRAVVLESTGDVSVLHADEDEPELEDRVLDGVNR